MIMNKRFYYVFGCLVCLNAFNCYGSVCTPKIKDANRQVVSEFEEVGIPSSVFSGMYYGVGTSYDSVSHKITFKDGGRPLVFTVPKSNSVKENTSNMSIFSLFGFGTTFENNVYCGLELEFFYRFCGAKKGDKSPGGTVILNKSTMGMGAYSRVGYNFSGHNSMPYLLFGGIRTIGKLTLVPSRDSIRKYSTTYGSFSPVVGIGVEKKISDRWNVRVEGHFVIGMKDDRRSANVGFVEGDIPSSSGVQQSKDKDEGVGVERKFDGKMTKKSIRLIVTYDL